MRKILGLMAIGGMVWLIYNEYNRVKTQNNPKIIK